MRLNILRALDSSLGRTGNPRLLDGADQLNEWVGHIRRFVSALSVSLTLCLGKLTPM